MFKKGVYIAFKPPVVKKIFFEDKLYNCFESWIKDFNRLFRDIENKDGNNKIFRSC